MKKDLLEQYTSRILSLFRITKDEFFSKTKKKELVDARQLLYFMAKDRQVNVVYIQDYMIENGHDICHSTIIHGINNVREKVESDEDYNKIIRNINSQVSI
jgi:chromosomal replication initiation ATPase DnaA